MHLERQINELRQRLLDLAGRVQEAIANAMRAVFTRDTSLAQAVIRGDHAIDEAEVAVEEECLKTLALYQPVAKDLRLVIAILKINNDLERMGDIAANIAKRAISLADYDATEFQDELEDIAEKVQGMIRDSLNALIAADVEAARRVCAMDDEIDAARRSMDQRTLRHLREGGQDAEYWVRLNAVFKHLERLADMATNIAEDAIYLVTGEIVRHRGEG